MSPEKKWMGRLLRILGGFMLLVSMALITVSLILAQPQSDEKKTSEPGPALTPSPAINISKEEELGSLISSFPIPVMSFMSGSGMRFVSATASDTAYHGGFARMATLYWQTPEGEGVILQSICPADTLDLLKDSEWHFSQIAGPTLFGIPTVRMENESMIRIHATTENGLYVFTLPASLSGSVSFLSRSLQLFTAPDRDAE